MRTPVIRTLAIGGLAAALTLAHATPQGASAAVLQQPCVTLSPVAPTGFPPVRLRAFYRSATSRLLLTR